MNFEVVVTNYNSLVIIYFNKKLITICYRNCYIYYYVEKKMAKEQDKKKYTDVYLYGGNYDDIGYVVDHPEDTRGVEVALKDGNAKTISDLLRSSGIIDSEKLMNLMLTEKSIGDKLPLEFLIDNQIMKISDLAQGSKFLTDRFVEQVKTAVAASRTNGTLKQYKEYADKLTKSGVGSERMIGAKKLLNKVFGIFKESILVHTIKQEIANQEKVKEVEAKAAEAKKAEAKAPAEETVKKPEEKVKEAAAKVAEAKAAENARIKENAKKNLEEVKKTTAAKSAAAEAKEAAAKAAEKAAENAKKAKQDNVKAFIGGYQNVLKAEFKNIKTKEEIKNLKTLINNTKDNSQKEKLQSDLLITEGMYKLSELESIKFRRDTQEAAKSAGIPEAVVKACDKFVDAKVSLVAQNREKSNKILESHFINLATQDMAAKLQTSLEVMQTAVSANNAEEKVNEVKSELKEAVGNNKDVANSFIDIVTSELDSIVLNDMADRYETQAMSAENTLKDPTLTPETKKALETSVKDNKKSEEICKEEAATRTEQSKSAQETFIAAVTEQTSKSQVKGEEKSTREASNVEQAMKQVREQNVLSGLGDVKSENVGGHSAPLTTTGVNKQTERNGVIGR